jgi:hypothetical protein
MKRLSLLALALSMAVATPGIAFGSDRTVIIQTDEDDYQQQYRCSPRRSHKGGLAPQMLWFDADLFERVQRYESDLKDLTFDFDNKKTFMLGGMGYSQYENGLRVGSGMWVGYKKHTSEVYNKPDSSGADREVITSLRLIPLYAGILVEKSQDLAFTTLYAGGFLGGGAYLMHRNTTEQGDVFSQSNHDEHDDSDTLNEEEVGAVAFAPLVTADVHVGASMRVSPYVELGAEFVLLFAYAPEGFVTGNGFGDFMTTTPGIRLRALFGSKSN